MACSSSSVRTYSLAQCCQARLHVNHVAAVRQVCSGLHLGCLDSGAQWAVPARGCGLLILQPQLYVVQGDALVVPWADGGFAKLQFFIDQGLPKLAGAVDSRANTGLWGAPVPLTRAEAARAWYLSQALDGSEGYAEFAQALRNTESYRLVEFLSDPRHAQYKLHELAQRYGVSVSHFRRLCRTAIGGTVKTELREWRTARALLTLARGCTSLTELALELGYASSSHFSREIKELAGLVPSRMGDITHLPRK